MALRMNEFYPTIVLRKKEESILFRVLLKEPEDSGEPEISLNEYQFGFGGFHCRAPFKTEFMVNFNFVGTLSV